MQRSAIDPGLRHILTGPATVGGLLDLCEENHQLLSTLAPRLHAFRGQYRARPAREGPELFLEVLEQSRYTTTLRLTYYFDGRAGPAADPDATLRVYHDARQVEVLGLRQRILPTVRAFSPPGLTRKWKANLFVSKWLLYCVASGYRFGPRASRRPAIAGTTSAP